MISLTMPRKSRQSPDVRAFILANVGDHPGAIGPLTARHFGLSRAAVSGYLQRLAAEGFLVASGNTRARKYARKSLVNEVFSVRLRRGMAEDLIWRERTLSHFDGVPQNIIDICQYGFTEMLNNCADHSASDEAVVSIVRYHDEIQMMITDRGIGIFEKIKADFGLTDPRHALLELSKGKLTSDKRRHAGEGVFFASRMFNKFGLHSGHLFYSRAVTGENEWLIETDDILEHRAGTAVCMNIRTDATWTTREVFGKFQEPGRISFRKTHVPIKLGKYPGEQLVSRSQAKRILARAGDFSEVLLDFQGIDQIGQAFADEIFRVFPAEHPEVVVLEMRSSPDVRKMINYVRNPDPDVSSPGEDFFSRGFLR
jgi:anti-sigma regulatory factor (Ser/Thr protein kinase)